MKFANIKDSEPTEKKGCSKNMHIFHMVFCFFLFIGVTQNFSSRHIEPFDIIAFSYSFVGLFYSFFKIIKITKIEKQEKILKQFRELDSAVLTLAKANNGCLTPSILSIKASVAIEEAKKILDTYVERGVAQIEVTEEGVFKYIFPEFLKQEK